jgi:hypothetical protein
MRFVRDPKAYGFRTIETAAEAAEVVFVVPGEVGRRGFRLPRAAGLDIAAVPVRLFQSIHKTFAADVH